MLPVLFEGEVKAVIELASFHAFSPIHQLFLDQLMESIGVVLNMIAANMRTEELLQQSQSLTQELQSQSKELTQQQEELKRTNSALEKQALELKEKAQLLAEQNTKVEVKNQEVEQARLSLEEKAEQLPLISKYKSEFLANMSHELRTPLNSLLILARLLSDNPDRNLTDKQVEYAKTIYASGGDLLTLINEILDLSKVEAGKMPIEPREVALADITDFVERSFRPSPSRRASASRSDVGRRSAHADLHRPAAAAADPEEPALQRASSSPARGSVALRVHRPKPGTHFANETLRQASVVALLGRRHRHRHPARQAAADLRSVPAGRRHHQPQVRRHGPGSVDLRAFDRPPPGRRDSCRQRSRQGKRVHALPARAPRRALGRRGGGGGGG